MYGGLSHDFPHADRIGAAADPYSRTYQSSSPLADHLFDETLDTFSTDIAVLDAQGIILHVNETWQRFAEDDDLQGDQYSVGRNYPEACIPTE